MFVTRWLLVPLLIALLGGLAANVWSAQDNGEMVAGALVVHGDLNVRGPLMIAGPLIVRRSITTSGRELQIVSRGTPPESSFSKVVRVSGSKEVDGPLIVQGSLTVDGNLNVAGPISIAGTIETVGQQ